MPDHTYIDPATCNHCSHSKSMHTYLPDEQQTAAYPTGCVGADFSAGCDCTGFEDRPHYLALLTQRMAEERRTIVQLATRIAQAAQEARAYFDTGDDFTDTREYPDMATLAEAVALHGHMAAYEQMMETMNIAQELDEETLGTIFPGLGGAR